MYRIMILIDKLNKIKYFRINIEMICTELWKSYQLFNNLIKTYHILNAVTFKRVLYEKILKLCFGHYIIKKICSNWNVVIFHIIILEKYNILWNICYWKICRWSLIRLRLVWDILYM